MSRGARISRTLALATIAAAATPAAHAHPGGHDHMSWLELARHYAEPDHLAVLALAGLVGWLAYRWGRRIEARGSAQRPGSPRDPKRERERP